MSSEVSVRAVIAVIAVIAVRAVIAVIAVIEGYYKIPNIRIKFNGNTTKKED
jgi:hypothetical protein